MNRTIRFFNWLWKHHNRIWALWNVYIHKSHKLEIIDIALGEAPNACLQVNAWGYRCKVCGDAFMSIPDKESISEIDNGNKTYSETFVWQEYLSNE